MQTLTRLDDQPLPTAQLSPDERSLWRKLLEFEAPYFEERLLEYKIVETPQQYEEAFLELKKFVFLSHKSAKSLAVLSPLVDEVWHQFILFTRHYHRFCEEHFGAYLHHTPDTSFTPPVDGSTTNFLSAYREVFGEPREPWNLTEKHRSSADRICCSTSGFDS